MGQVTNKMYVVKAILIVRHWLAVSVPIVQMDPRKTLEDTTVKATLPLLTKSIMFLFIEIQSSVGAQVRVMPPQVATKHHELKIDRGQVKPITPKHRNSCSHSNFCSPAR